MSCGWLNKTSIVESGDKLKVTIWHAYGLHLPELTAGFKLPKETETVEFEIPKSSCEFSKTNSILLDCNTKDVEMVFSDYDKKVTAKEIAKTFWMRNYAGVRKIELMLSLDFRQVPYSGTGITQDFYRCSNTKPKVW
jgi:hypothetical protein